MRGSIPLLRAFSREHTLWLVSILVISICLSFIFAVIQRSELFVPYDPQHWENEYNSSQWMVKENPRIITDEALYAHVGGLLLIGHDPSLINAEVPPFGKYVIGWINATSGYIGIYGLIFSGLSLLLFFLLNKILFKSTLLALIPVLLFSFDSIFREQVAVGLLDSLYLCMLLLTFILFLNKKFYIAALAAGLFMAIKSPFLIIVVYLLLFAFMAIRQELTIKRFIIMPLLTLGVYILTHIQIFILGHDFWYFLSVQKYMIHFYQIGAQGVFGAIVPLLLGGYWITWYGENMFVKEWSILWPLISLASLFAFYRLLKRRIFSNHFFFILLWSILYFGFLCFTPIFPRYLLLLLPFLYNLSIWVLLSNTDSKS